MFAMNTVTKGHGLCILEKVADTGRTNPSFRAWPDHFIEALGACC